MAKICPSLESKADIFFSYLPKSDINLAAEESVWHRPHSRKCCVLPVLSALSEDALSRPRSVH